MHFESIGNTMDNGGKVTKSSLSVESGSSSRGGGLTWTPPTGSAEGSTPTWTEGTPSFTESSSSGDVGKFEFILLSTCQKKKKQKIPSGRTRTGNVYSLFYLMNEFNF